MPHKRHDSGHISEAYQMHFVDLPPEAHSSTCMHFFLRQLFLLTLYLSGTSTFELKHTKHSTGTIALNFPMPPSSQLSLSLDPLYPHLHAYSDHIPQHPYHSSTSSASASFATLPRRNEFPDVSNLNRLYREPSPQQWIHSAKAGHNLELPIPRATHIDTQPRTQRVMSGYIDPLSETSEPSTVLDIVTSVTKKPLSSTKYRAARSLRFGRPTNAYDEIQAFTQYSRAKWLTRLNSTAG
ncbi:hypothetical protein F5050DRAFT_1896546 [Lentinula boryana]|uniref:Uncharacterized protein n=1 Tax=Lentinula boryana TaxID=40481 RepID=A0ABQ8Q7G1_9AGAR|nr:hypothetical protein F5050DRAFT_1896546 [Lentinula boryana]